MILNLCPVSLSQSKTRHCRKYSFSVQKMDTNSDAILFIIFPNLHNFPFPIFQPLPFEIIFHLFPGFFCLLNLYQEGPSNAEVNLRNVC